MFDTEHIVQQYLIAIKGGSQRTIVEKCMVLNKIAKLNLHNGLYIVNVSNEAALELTISAPEEIIVPVLNLSNNAFHLPLLTSFGTVNLIFEIIKSNI